MIEQTAVIPSNAPDYNSLKSIFSPEFLKTPVEKISEDIAKTGFYFFDQAVRPEFVDQIIKESTATEIGFNYNDVTPVRNFKQTFFANCLGGSASIVRIISSSLVFDISRKYLGSQFRLKCQRYYESGKGYQLGWHTDNKTVENEKTNVKGIVFIVYLVDTNDGELEVVKGSHNWSGESLSNDFEDAELRKSHSQDILALKGKKGSLVITDTWTVHRTAMLKTPGFIRKSLFFQIDDDLSHSEKILLNPEFLPRDMTPEMQQFFGFGLPSGYKTMPVSGLHTLTSKDLWTLLFSCTKILVKRIPLLKQTYRFLTGKKEKKLNVING